MTQEETETVVVDSSGPTWNSLWRWPVAGVLVLAGVCLLLFPLPIAKYTGYNALNAHAMGLVDESLERDQATFLVITAIKATLAVIEGSEVGVGFELEVGDVVQPAYDYVNFFWEMFLYAFLILGSYKLLMETGLLGLGLMLMGLGFVLLAASLVSPAQVTALRRWGRRTLLGGALFAYAVPVALIATHALSDRYTTAIKEQHLQEIKALDQQLEKLSKQFIALKDQINLLSPGATIENLKNGMYGIAQAVGETFQKSLSAFLYFMLVIAFEVVLFPFLSAWMLFKFGQFALGRAIPVAAPAPAPATT